MHLRHAGAFSVYRTVALPSLLGPNEVDALVREIV